MTVTTIDRRGFTMMEILCVIAVLTVLMGMLALLLGETLEVERSQSARLQRMGQHQILADQFRADVAAAEQAPSEWKEFKAGPGTLILQMKDGHVVYVWQDEKLKRLVIEAGKEEAAFLAIDGNRIGLEFGRDGEDAKLLRLRLGTLREGSSLPGQSLEIAAALGGDWR